MRVCPKCGYIDPPQWRTSIKGYSYTEYENFKELHPDLAKKVTSQKHVISKDNLYVYHLTRGGFVERWAIMENPTYEKSWSIPMEKAKHRTTSNMRSDFNRYLKRKKSQTKLLEK